MGTQLTKADLRGFLVPYKLTKEHIWEAQSTFTQQEFFSSSPVPILFCIQLQA